MRKGTGMDISAFTVMVRREGVVLPSIGGVTIVADGL